MTRTDQSDVEVLEHMATLFQDMLFREGQLLDSALASSSLNDMDKKQISSSHNLSRELLSQVRSEIKTLKGS